MKEARVACHGKRAEQSETAAFFDLCGKEREALNAFERAFFLYEKTKKLESKGVIAKRRNCGTAELVRN